MYYNRYYYSLSGAKMYKPPVAYSIFILLAAAYVALILLLPPDPISLAQYNLTVESARKLSLSFALPYIIIWFIACYGALTLKGYGQSIDNHNDGKALTTIAEGLFIIALIMPVTAILTRVANFIGTAYPDLRPVSSITNLYVDLIFGLFAMTLLYLGAQRLANTLEKNTHQTPMYLVVIATSVIGVTFSYIALTDPNRQFPASASSRALFYMPDPLIIATVVLPLVYIYYRALAAVYFLMIYRQKVNGSIYRSALGYISVGVLFVVLSRLSIRYMNSVTANFSRGNLKPLLVALYCLFFVIGLGFILTAKGAMKLRKIEEA